MNYETQVKGDTRAAEEPTEEELRKRRRTMIVVGAVALLLVAVYVAVKMLSGGGEDDKAAEQPQTVSVATAQPQSVTSIINSTGTIGAIRDMPVGVVGEGGRVLSVLVEPGAWVGKGQVLAVIERSVQAQEIASLAAQVDVARADAKLAEANLTRAKALVANGFISKADIDQRTATRDAAVARVNVAIATLNQARARVGRLDVRAPEAGLVLTRTIEPGQIVSGGSGVLFRIAQGGRLEVQARLSEGDLAQVRVGTQATVVPSGESRSFPGSVWQVAPVIDPNTRLGIARVALGFDKSLRPGGFAAVQIAAGSARAPVMPESAVQGDAKGSYVYIVNARNKVERRAVKTGAITAAGVPILSGLSGGEKVVLYAAGFLNPGETVRPRLQQPGAAR